MYSANIHCMSAECNLFAIEYCFMHQPELNDIQVNIHDLSAKSDRCNNEYSLGHQA